MRKIIQLVITTALLVSTSVSQAGQQWSACVNVTGVQDYRAWEGAVYLVTNPRISSCNYGGVDRVRIQENYQGIPADQVKGALAIGMAAYLTGKKVQVFYDDATPQCDSVVIALNGVFGNCN